MTGMEYLIFGLILALCLAALGAFFSPDDFPRWFSALWAGLFFASLWLLGGFVYAVVHFGSKYW